MNKLKTIAEINIRITQLERKLEEINAEIDKQVERPFFQRNPGICLFLDVEKKRYAASLMELKWVINE